MSNEEAARMAAAGADVIGAMIGVTSGGMSEPAKQPPWRKQLMPSVR